MPDMSRYQCALVDTCFEEGHYLPGIALLDQLRSESFSPHPHHLRQLLYIALFPPPQPGDQSSSLFLSVADSEAAQRALFSFLATNSPAALARALPPDADGSDSLNHDSLIARESCCIKNCRHCWAILRQGFIQHIPQDTAKKRTRSTYDPDCEQALDTPAVVAEHAWPVLDWLLSLFEKDEPCEPQNFSPLLLSQIPSPRGGSGPRWEASAPLDIIFHAIEEEDGQRRAMATRLLTLLINLTLSGSFDATMFAAALSTRLYTSSPQTVQNLMEGLPKTVPVLAFKITVCQEFLSSGLSITEGSKPRPRPLPKRGPRRDSPVASSATDIDVGRAGSSVAPSPVLACSDVFQLLRSDHKSVKSPPAPPASTIKYVLLVSYAHLQRLLPPGERDGDWKDALSNGGLQHVVDTAFANDSTYRTALTILTGVWTPSD